MMIFANKVDANTDSLKQIWTNPAQPDSIRFKAINEYYKKYRHTSSDSMFLLTTYHIDLAEQKDSKKEKAIALSYRAIILGRKGDRDNALTEMHKAADLYSILNDSSNLAKAYNNLGLMYTKQIEYQKAIDFFSKSLALSQAIKMEALQAFTLISLAQIHLDIDNYDVALAYFNKSLRLYEKLELDNKVGRIWLNFGKVYFEKKNYQQALENNQKALKINQPLKKQFVIANSYTLNAKIYQELNQIDSALFYIEKGLELHQEIGADLLILKDKIILANLIFPTDVNRATKMGEEILKTAGDYRDYSMKIDLYNLLYKCYKKKKNYPLAISMLENYNAYADSLSIEQDPISFAKKAIQMEYEAKIFKEQLENEQSQSQLKLNQLKKTYAIFFLGSLIILCIIFHYRAKKIIDSKKQEVLLHKINHLKELDKTRHQLIQSEKMASLGQLTAGVAHEINNPINFITSGVIGLKKTLNAYIEGPKNQATGELVEDMNDMISAIAEGAKRTSTIVKSLRLFSREDTENYIKADIITGLEATFRLLSNKLGDGVFLEKEFEKKAMPIFCFPGQLNQVFMNILLNAIQAVEGAGIIKVVVKEQGRNIAISISDNGMGIPEEKKQKIFDPFYTTKDVQEGTGLGLSITFGIIKKHNGSIEVKNNEPKGTTFIINLPKRAERLIS